MITPEILIEKTIAGTPDPAYAHKGDAAIDICFMEVDDSFGRNRGISVNEEGTLTMQPGGKCRVKVGLKMNIQKGFAGILAPRSGLGTKQEVTLCNSIGVIDSCYRGEVMAVIKTAEEIEIKKRDAISQMMFFYSPEAVLKIVDDVTAGDEDNERGDGGFGSSGTARN